MNPSIVTLNVDSQSLPLGNWWDFPPPRPGVYNVRRVRGNTDRCDFYPDQVVTYRVQHGFYVGAKSLSRFPPDAGWQFQFKAGEIAWKPVEVLYDTFGMERTYLPATRGTRLATRDLNTELPTAYSREEAWYIIKLLPKRWPDLSVKHVEFVEQTH